MDCAGSERSECSGGLRGNEFKFLVHGADYITLQIFRKQLHVIPCRAMSRQHQIFLLTIFPPLIYIQINERFR